MLLPYFVRAGICAAILAAGFMSVERPVHADEENKTDNKIVIAAFGDSLSAGYQLPQPLAFPNQLEAALKDKGYNVQVLNAAVSGDTTSGGLARLDWSLPKNVDAVILELGANDALRGLDPAHTKVTLDKIVTALKARNVEVLIAGMEAPRGLGKDYVEAFRALFKDIATKYDTLFYPFFLEGIALDPKYNLSDGMHPNGEGVGIIVRNILPSVEQLIARVKALKKG